MDEMEKVALVAALELGYAWAELRMRAEAAVCTPERDFENLSLQVALAVATTLQTHLEKLMDRHTQRHHREAHQALNAAWDAVEPFTEYLQTIWHDSNRTREIAAIHARDTGEVDWGFERDQAIVEESLVKAESWGRLSDCLVGVSSRIEPHEKAAMRIGQLLGAWVFPAISSGGWRSLPADRELAAIRIDLHQAVNQAMTDLVEVCPEAGGIDIDFSKSTAQLNAANHVVDRAEKLMRDLKTVIMQSQPQAGYLDLLLARDHHEIHRQGNRVRLQGDLAWRLLEKLFKNQADYTRSDTLLSVWDRTADVPTQQGTLERQVSDLRKALQPLGVTVSRKTDFGYRLELLKHAPGDQAV